MHGLPVRTPPKYLRWERLSHPHPHRKNTHGFGLIRRRSVLHVWKLYKPFRKWGSFLIYMTLPPPHILFTYGSFLKPQCVCNLLLSSIILAEKRTYRKVQYIYTVYIYVNRNRKNQGLSSVVHIYEWQEKDAFLGESEGKAVGLLWVLSVLLLWVLAL